MIKYYLLIGVALVLVAPEYAIKLAKLLSFSAGVGLLWSWVLSSRHDKIVGAGVTCNGDTDLFGATFWSAATLTALFPPTAWVTVPAAILTKLFV